MISAVEVQPEPPPTVATSTAWIRIVRPQQWTKNGFCLAGLVFGTRLQEPDAWASAFIAFVFFCVASSCMYLVNDLNDIERDRLHPKKRLRPLPSGQIKPAQAAWLAVILGIAALSSVSVLDFRAYACLCAYAILNLTYSLWLKHQVLLDVAAIAFGFVLRMLGGVYAVDEIPTTWIALCTFFLALFLGFAKRRAELADLLTVSGNSQRPVLAKYSIVYLDSLLNSTAAMTILTYALFTVGAGKNPTLIMTVPMVYLAIMQYQLLICRREGGEEPEQIILRNRSIQFWIVLWLFSYLFITNSSLRLFK
jgi:4-hydroxybenzoate polyprenyltransferase